MRKKRILYNELSDDIYEASSITKSKLIFLGVVVLFISFLANLSLEEKVNRLLSTYLMGNPQCPMQFEKAELGYFPPKITIKKMTIMGACFNQMSNRLFIDDLILAPDFPSITKLGLRMSIQVKAEDSNIKISPIFSLFGRYIEIEKSTINAKIFHILTSDDKSPIAGKIFIKGFLKFEADTLTDGHIEMDSNNFHFPSQRISGFDLPLIQLDKFNLEALFERAGEMKIKKIEIGKPGKQIEINLAGKLQISKSSFVSSILNLDGTMKLSPAFMNNFSFVTLILPPGHPDGKYQMKINGPLLNPGSPQFQ